MSDQESSLSLEELVETASRLESEGDHGAAVGLYRAVLEQLAPILYRFGVASERRGSRSEAVRALALVTSLTRGADRNRARIALAGALLRSGAPREAAAEANEIPEEAAEHPEARSLLALAKQAVGEATAETFEAILKDAPNDVDAWRGLAMERWQSGELELAIEAASAALAIEPESMSLRALLIGLFLNVGRRDEAKALLPGPERPDPLPSSLLFALNSVDDLDAARLFKEHELWGHRVEALQPARQQRVGSRDPDRPLRVGYVSYDFKLHPVSYFFFPLLAAHDRAAFHVTCYSTSPIEDAMTGLLRELRPRWRGAAALSDEALARLIRADEIDVLVDLSGHTDGHRLAVFASRPAPVQISYLGYPNTTGLTAIDYYMTDSVCSPPGKSEHLFTERLLRVDPIHLCYRPIVKGLPVAAPPASVNGGVTFGSFAGGHKITDSSLRTWVRVLSEVPNSQLLMKLGQAHDALTRREISTRWKALGGDCTRLSFLDFDRNFAAHMSSYGRIDVLLDAFPYNGTTTTCDALWMGVPVVTLAGDAHRSRMGATLLGSVGLDEYVAGSVDEYVDIAARLASKPRHFGELRGRIRGLMEASPLMDAGGLARRVEDRYREVWRARCALAGEI